ncbi:MAG: Xaa-Pro peptidase family protein [archaeon GB-1867-005]|nr:Xaa-Pro peptidase family protein [Candidatus Culexmicrobium cathedralense]
MSELADAFRVRFERIAGLLRGRGVDGLLLFPGANLYYFTGFMIGLSERPSVAVLPFDDEPVLIVPELERDLRGQRPWINCVEVWREWEDPFRLIANVMRRRGLAEGLVGVCEMAPWGWVRRIGRLLPKVGFVDVSDAINSLRMVKSEFEVAKIRAACRIVDRAVKAGFESLEEGLTELELSSIIEGEARRLGGRPSFCTVLFGERAALPHGSPSDRELRRGDVVLVDAGVIVDGYHSDITRTVVFGEPSGRQRRIWEVVFNANRAAIEYIRPGVTCEDADRVAREIIIRAGFGEHFIHRLGHGIGLEVHEHPYLVRGNGLRLKAGMTFTIEPGIYISGELGVRIEDTVLCTSGGCASLTMLERSITI